MYMNIFWDGIEPDSLADYIELYLLVTKAKLSKSDILSFVQNNEQVSEEDVDVAFSQLDNRLKHYYPFIPFSTNNNILVSADDISLKTHSEYAMCLLFSLNGAASQYEATHLFEDVVAESLRNHLGPHSKVKEIGRCRHLSGITKDIADFLSTCALDKPCDTDNDGGVDIISAVTFLDEKHGKLTLLTDCAAGSLWENKKAIPLTKWEELFQWGKGRPVPSIAIPGIISNEHRKEKGKEYGIIIDRPRILKGLYLYSFRKEYGSIKDKVLSWCESELKKII